MYCNGRILKPLFWIVLFCPLLFHVYILCTGSGKELESPSPQCWLGHRHATQAKPLDRPRDFHSWSWKGHIGGIQGNWSTSYCKSGRARSYSKLQKRKWCQAKNCGCWENGWKVVCVGFLSEEMPSLPAASCSKGISGTALSRLSSLFL